MSKHCTILCFLGIILSIHFLHAQDKTIPEKTYLHTDRSIYFVGEDLWYKAYNVNAYNNSLFDNSNILYVELIAPDSKIIARKKTNLEMGLGNGDFQLADSLGVKSGHYQLRAYTNWNRNFGDDFVFKKDIEIINVFEENSRATKDKKIQNATSISKTITTGEQQNTPKIDFFPEGGSLLENVTSVIGFKAVDSNGNPVELSGDVYDSNNELVTSFSSSHNGMGKFQIIPLEGKEYYAKIKTPIGAEFRVILPKALQNGYLLSYRMVKGKNIITITTNTLTLSQNPNSALTIFCKAKGISYLETIQMLTQNSLSFELPKDKTHEGISQITLFDSNLKPQSERLIYIEKEQDLEVLVTADKKSYKPNEKTTLNISSKSKAGLAKSASFSMSVTDMNGVVNEKDFDSNISSYFLIESDIRGKVHNPGYYFDATNLKRLEHLDDLLLTQGWRDFVWKTMPKVDEKMSYKAEKGFTISGSVKQMFGSKVLENNKLSLTLKNEKQMNFFSAVTSSSGSFKFENLIFFGKTTMFLNNRNQKGKFGGEIVLDPIEQATLPVLFKKSEFDLPERTRLIAKNVFEKYVNFGVDPENILEEVAIIGKKKEVSIYGVPDYTYTADENTEKLPRVYDVLSEVSGVWVRSDTIVSISGETGAPLILVDGDPVLKAELEFVNSNEIIKIEVTRGNFSGYFITDEGMKTGGIISIFTKGSLRNRPRKESVHAFSKKIEGFQTARVFYAPNPEKPNPELDNKLEVRNTIYWNPYVHPDKTGNINLSYYNSNFVAKVKVVLEGITGSGIPVVKKMYYNVNK